MATGIGNPSELGISSVYGPSPEPGPYLTAITFPLTVVDRYRDGGVREGLRCVRVDGGGVSGYWTGSTS